MLQKPNFLVLDEPTNNLDLESINALNIALQKYPGTLLLVTHDHDVIDEDWNVTGVTAKVFDKARRQLGMQVLAYFVDDPQILVERQRIMLG